MAGTFPVRKQIRLSGWDYSCKAYYHVTVCVARRAPILGSVRDDGAADAVRIGGSVAVVALSDVGRCVEAAIDAALARYPSVALDAHVVMPNHVHLLLGFCGGDVSLARFIGFMKSAATRAARRGCSGLQLWQRGYYERIIRDEDDYRIVREYIASNPAKWREDKYYTT